MKARTKPKGIGIAATMLLATLLIAAVIVLAVTATPERSMDKWIKDHTINVESTTIYMYDQGYLEITKIYTGEDLEKRFDVSNLTRSRKIPVEGRAIGMKEGDEKVFIAEKSTVLTTADDPFQWWDSHDYPQWACSRWWDGAQWIYEEEDPVNLAWENTNINTTKSEILEENWTDEPWEYTYYVYDSEYGWMADDGVADDKYRLFGGYHARLWQMSDGDVVANAHHDDSTINWPPLHQADEYEPAEDLVAGF